MESASSTMALLTYKESDIKKKKQIPNTLQHHQNPHQDNPLWAAFHVTKLICIYMEEEEEEKEKEEGQRREEQQ